MDKETGSETTRGWLTASSAVLWTVDRFSVKDTPIASISMGRACLLLDLIRGPNGTDGPEGETC
jgi:hypothetical protein